MAAGSSSGTTAGSRRFWVTVLIFAILNVGAWAGYGLWQKHHAAKQDLLRVVDFSSPNADELNSGPAKITWTFNLDVGKPGNITTDSRGKLPGSIKPAVDGAWRWVDERTLMYESRAKLPKATRFVATIEPGSFKTPEGFVLAAADSRTFETEPLRFLGAKQIAFNPDNSVIIELSFNDKVIPGEVLQHLTVFGPDEKPVQTRIHGEGAGTIVRVRTDPIQFDLPVIDGKTQKRSEGANKLKVTVSAGLVGAAGPLGLEKDETQQADIANMLLVDSINGHAGINSTLVLHFNNDISEEMLGRIRPLISVEPAVKFVADRRGWSSYDVTLTGDFKPGSRYLVTIAAAEAGDDVRKYPRPTKLSVLLPDMEPTAFFEQGEGYLASRGNRTVLAKVVNIPAVHVKAYRIYENNLVTWANHSGETQEYGRPVASKRFVLKHQKNQMEDLRINVDDLIGKEKAREGVYGLVITAANKGSQEEDDLNQDDSESRQRNECIVILSDIGLTAKITADARDNNERKSAEADQSLVAWVVSLSSGKPMGQVQARVYSDKNQLLGEALSDEQGLVRIEHFKVPAGEQAAVIVAQNGSGESTSLTALRLSASQWDESRLAISGKSYLHTGYEAFVWPERGAYRPGETVTLRAIVRGADMMVPPAGMPLRWQLRRPDGHDWLNKSVQVDADGGAEWKVTFPDDAQSGNWSAVLGLPGEVGSGSNGMKVFGSVNFQIEDFMPDRIKSNVTIATPNSDKTEDRLTVGEVPAKVEIQGDYLFGQPAAGLTCELKVRMWPTLFVSPQWPSAQGWKSGDTERVADVMLDKNRSAIGDVAWLKDKLNDQGHALFKVDLRKGLSKSDGLYESRGPWLTSVTASITEIGGRTVTAYEMMEADVLPYYVMFRAKESNRDDYITVGIEARYELQLVKPNGEKFGESRTLAATIFREEWENVLIRKGDRYQYDSQRKLRPVEGGDLTLQVAQGAGQFAWKPERTGSYVIQFADMATRQIATTRLWVGEPDGWNDTISREHPSELEIQLVSDDGASQKFKPGQHVKAVVKSPFAGQLLLTVETDHVLLTRVAAMTQSTGEISFEMPEGIRPNGYVSAAVIRPVVAGVKATSHRAYGIRRFVADPADHTLNVEVKTVSEMRPVNPLDAAVIITDSKGQPVANAAVALWAVDEGILRLTGFKTPQPWSCFDALRALGIETSDVYTVLLPEVPLPDNPSKVGGDGDLSSPRLRHLSPVTARRVRPVSLISTIVHTDAEGKAKVQLQVPEFLGQLRVMATAYYGPMMGAGQSTVLVRTPLVVQSSFPRFLAPGDSCASTFLVINNAKDAGEVRLNVTAEPKDLLSIESSDQKLQLAAGGQQVVKVGLKAGAGIGTAKIVIAAAMGEEKVAEHLEIPIRPLNVMISRGDTVTATNDNPATLALPEGMLKGSESAQIRITQRPALGLDDGLEYLNRYPYGCLEQTTSKAFALLYLKDIGDAIAPNLAETYQSQRKVEAAIMRLIGMQTASGGLAMWPGSTEDWPWGTVYAAHFLSEAKAAKYMVPGDFEVRLIAYLRSLLAKTTVAGEGLETQAYACYVLALHGKPDRAMMNRLGEILDAELRRGESAPELSDARAHLALAWLATGRKDLAEHLIPQTIPTFNFPRRQGGALASPVRSTALLALTLLNIQPDHPSVPQLIERLKADRKNWLSTQDHALVVMAIGKFLRATSGDRTYESAAIMNGNTTLAKTDHDRALLWTWSPDIKGPLTVRVEGGAGAKAYVSWIQNGIPTEPFKEADHGVKIRREYLNEKDEPVDLATVTMGDAVKVRVTVDAPTALSSFVIEDLLPAGLEVENPRLKTSAQQDEGEQKTKAIPTISAQRLDVRDDRVVIVANIASGKSVWTYLTRAVTPGAYSLAPVRGECMYDAGINSISGEGQLTIRAAEK